MTTDQAFSQLLNDKELCLEKGMSEGNHRQLKKRFSDNDPLLTIQTKIQWLERAGYVYKLTWKNPR